MAKADFANPIPALEPVHCNCQALRQAARHVSQIYDAHLAAVGLKTQQYSILANSTGGVVEFAAATAVLYMGMSVPLSWFSRWSERRLGASVAKGGVPG